MRRDIHVAPGRETATAMLAKLILAATLALVMSTSLAAAQDDPFTLAQANYVLAMLDSLPHTLVVTHTPDPAVAVEDSTARYRYTWHFSTSVASTAGAVTILEFGGLNRVGDRWLFANSGGKSFTSGQFAQWYGCEGAIVHEGTPCTDASNWWGDSVLEEGRSLWYFFGKDETGRRVVGSAEIVREAKIAPAAK
jgi:hypothetical protein